MGNVVSVQKALKYLNIPNQISSNPVDLKSSDFIILPGVGAFQKGIQNLHELGFYEIIREEVIEGKKPFMGFCLGMQLLASVGHEYQLTSGLDLIKGEVIRIETRDKRVPHMGWNTVNPLQGEYFEGIDVLDYYFVHSYHFVPNEENVVAATVNYENDYVACVSKDNIFGTQFHPEKSQDAGLSLMKNFFQKYAKS